MSVPPELMQAMAAGGGKPAGGPAGGGQTAGGGSAAAAAPSGGPMSTPQPQKGLEMSARVNVEIAVRLLEQSMSAFPMDSDEKRSITKAHETLVTKFGKSRERASELIPAELQQLAQNMPGGAPGAQKPQGAPAGAA